ncbi:MAG: hypothetical protein M3O35_22060 [Acidobacteriota bacterium]|nr:hypothetical protein [Acidobacteriota bacterium]
MLGVKVTERAEVPFGEHAVFDGPDAIDAPLIVGDGLGELALHRGAGVEAVDQVLGEGLISIQILSGKHYDAGSEAVAQRVQAGSDLAGRGSGAGGFLRVEAIRCELCW